MKTGFNSSRRQFFKVGVLGSATLGIAACSNLLSRKSELCHDCEWLRTKERPILQAIIPVMLAGALPYKGEEHKTAVTEIIKNFDYTVAHFPASVRDEIQQLMWVLQSPVPRAVVAGVWGAWENVTEEDVRALLDNWKNSGFDLLRVGYLALHDLICGAWYSSPHAWQRIHYPGPPALT